MIVFNMNKHEDLDLAILTVLLKGKLQSYAKTLNTNYLGKIIRLRKVQFHMFSSVQGSAVQSIVNLMVVCQEFFKSDKIKSACSFC